MSGDLVMVHTVAPLADLFDALRAEIDPDVPVRHVVQAALLNDAIDAGELTDEIRARTCAALLAATEGAGVVLCTCSTVGPGADDAAAQSGVPILRVDRPMAEAAVEAGRRITVAATLATTIEPTAGLIADAARRAGKEVEIRSVVFAEARARLVAGDSDGHERIIADGLHEAAASADAIVLAQASMTAALARCADIAIPLLTSPRSGLEAAIARWRAAA
ncbi:MAG: aspartate/glutamate racemase family protein [Rhodospirillales bacterium]|nr:aspartate/glutamate racemase family protein [Rhodospirillales bacterium]MDE0379859.1 aspartate/glutamate racemase family protein [Rhodospirillales bacterium]